MNINEEIILGLLSTVTVYCYQFDTSEEFIRIFPTAKDSLGIASSIHSGSYEWWAKKVHSDDLKTQINLFDNWVKSGCKNILFRKYRFKGQDNNFYLIEDRLKAVDKIDGSFSFVGSFSIVETVETLQRRLSLATENLPAVLYEFELLENGISRFPYTSSKVKELFGITPEDLDIDSEVFFQSIHMDDRNRVMNTIRESANTNTELLLEFRTVIDEKVSWFSTKAQPVRTSKSTKWQGIFSDITQEKQLSEALETNQRLLMRAQEIAGIGSWRVYESNMEMVGSDTFIKILQLPEDRQVFHFEDFIDIFLNEDQTNLTKAFSTAISVNTTLNISPRLKTLSQPPRTINICGDYVDDSTFTGWVGVIKDITEQVNEEEKLKHVASIDELTGSFNRRHLMQILEKKFNSISSTKGLQTVIVFDVDNFKSINDTYGHTFGDEVLKKIVQVVSSCLRTQDLIARLGGEEFVVLLQDCSINNALLIAEDMRSSIASNEFLINDKKFNITATFGISQIHPDDKDYKDAISRADIAMYDGKSHGKNQVCLATEPRTNTND